MSDLTIPAAVLEAAARADYEAIANQCEGALPWDELTHVVQDDHRTCARAAGLAMLKAWPGKFLGQPYEKDTGTAIILPLTEKPDDKA